jgi:hypothetical protein
VGIAEMGKEHSCLQSPAESKVMLGVFVHTCNPSYPGSTDRRLGSRPAWVIWFVIYFIIIVFSDRVCCADQAGLQCSIFLPLALSGRMSGFFFF